MSDLYERSAAVMPPFALHKMPFGIDHASSNDSVWRETPISASAHSVLLL